MRNVFIVIVIAALAASAFGQATVMVHTNTGVLRSPTNFVDANGIARLSTVTGLVAAVRGDLTNVSTRVGIIEVAGGYSPTLGSGSTNLVTRTAVTVAITNGVYPAAAAGLYWLDSVTNGEAVYRNTAGWYSWFHNDLYYYIGTNVGSTNGIHWSSYVFRDGDYSPFNGASGVVSAASTSCRPAAQLGVGISTNPGIMKWLDQPIADGLQGLYIGGAIWTNALTLTNISFISGVSTGGAGEIHTTTGTVTVVIPR